MKLLGELQAGAEALGVPLQQAQYEQLLAYLDLLERWNQVYNLTAIKGLPAMVPHHLLDSLSWRPRLEPEVRGLDVGSGAGLPGIPLAIAMPESVWTLLDSNARKTRFIRQAIAHCGLNNARVVHARVQDYHAPESLDIIVSRAYAPLAEFCRSVDHLLGPNTRMLTMKAGLNHAEAQQLDSNRFNVEETVINVPGINQPRSLVTVTAS